MNRFEPGKPGHEGNRSLFAIPPANDFDLLIGVGIDVGDAGFQLAKPDSWPEE
ncbi:MAG: hypothetical protein JJE04_07750 [Acidobacteriia bacterium]|nr:hypothetical protein [Terriglobia bacterium]